MEISDESLINFITILGIAVFSLIAMFHFVAATPSDALLQEHKD